MFDAATAAHAESVLAAFRAKGLMLATVESCTGGLVAGALTAVAGSSDVVERGFVTYSNRAKSELVGVPEAVLAAYGAVSEQTARAMAEGAIARAPVQAAVSVTGVAGPGGGSTEKPVGLVHFGCAVVGGETVHRRMLFGELGRDEIRRRSVLVALDLLLEAAARA
ncbi:CinA family protein [Xanthobacter tagetidis]|jgi:nicotinamide-nucleotide amidase|uniref:CinA family protein n=1 Tax=Xanthobacter tagetidis TaxID=60216 RepID=A0A3L7AE25_9HYPH|nr:CinA family protein [Xanthobacter tagetidis]MBB6309733.1 nicotinamide-nucleotide amidase [Xanthobacter tagetidis]RLP78235.1 CinA family protein [Xanthobacter tagetidis]